MVTKMQKNEFMDDYNRWAGMSFPREKADHDDVYDIRYDLYEVDMNLAGSFIRLVQLDFKDIDSDIDDEELRSLLNRAKALRSKVGENDMKIIDNYISRMEVLLRMCTKYKQLSHS